MLSKRICKKCSYYKVLRDADRQRYIALTRVVLPFAPRSINLEAEVKRMWWCGLNPLTGPRDFILSCVVRGSEVPENCPFVTEHVLETQEC